MRRKQMSIKEIDVIKKLNESGLSFMEIAIKKKMSLWTVKYHLDEVYQESVMRNNLKRNRKIAKKNKEKNE